MSEHPTKVRGFESIQEAAEFIENMQYDGLAEFMMHLSNALHGRATRDRFDGKPMLAHRLERAADRVGEAVIELKAVWKVCQRHMGEASGK